MPNIVPIRIVVGFDDNVVPVKFVAPGPNIVPCQVTAGTKNIVPVREVITETPYVRMNQVA